ncbi:MAG: beta-propeller fold lactonase family protein [Terracidiphilus sp.]
MKCRILAGLCVASFVVLAGCKGFWDPPPSTSTTTTTPTTLSSGVFYVLNQTTDQIVTFAISSGTLPSGTALTLPAPGPLAIAVAPNGHFLYVSTTGGIFLYTIASNGALTLGNNSQAISQDPAWTMQVDATNSWLVDAVSGTGQLSAIAINPSNGTLAVANETEQQFPGGLPATTLTQLAISPTDSSTCNDCYVFVAMGTGGTEFIGFDPANANPFGNSGHINLVNPSGGDSAVAVDPTNRLLYVGETDVLPSATQTGGLRVFTIGTGGVTEFTTGNGYPYATSGAGPSAILPTSDGNYLFAANKSISGSSSANIAEFSVSSTSLTSIGAVAAGPQGKIGLAEDSMSHFVLAVDFAGNPDLDAYTMKSGALTSAITSTTGTDPVGAVAVAALP